jgi:hypothetical protein
MSHDNHNANDHSDDHEDPDGWATWAIGLGSSVLVIAAVVISAGIYYRSMMTEAETKNINITFEQRDMIKAAQHAVLEESAHWVQDHDEKTGETRHRLVIPITDAMDIVAGNTK